MMSKTMVRNLPFDLENPKECVVYYEALTKDEQRSISYLCANYSGKALVEHITVVFEALNLYKVIKDFPNVQLLVDVKQEILKFLRETHQSKYSRNYRKLTDEETVFYKMKLKELHQQYKLVQEWAIPFVQIIKEFNRQKKFTPNTNSLHWQQTQDLAEHLKELWFIRKIGLYGSVAKGLEKPNSDIDIYLDLGIDVTHLTPALISNFSDVVERHICDLENQATNEISRQYNLNASVFNSKDDSLFSVTIRDTFSKKHKEFYDKVGFYLNDITLVERENFTFKLHDITETIEYKNITIAMMDRYSMRSYGIEVVGEDSQFLYLKCFTYDFNDNEVYTASRLDIFAIYKEKYTLHQAKLFGINDQKEYENFKEAAANQQIEQWIKQHKKESSLRKTVEFFGLFEKDAFKKALNKQGLITFNPLEI